MRIIIKISVLANSFEVQRTATQKIQERARGGSFRQAELEVGRFVGDGADAGAPPRA